MVCYYRFGLLIRCVLSVVFLLNVQPLKAKHTVGKPVLLALVAAMCDSRLYLRHRTPLYVPLRIPNGEQQGEGC